ncbi:DUF2726 domain-containing protein [Litoribacter alkaliphilus]|uniref:DUF2726 domain-containing protein n=1 Tax=Litoribacter ruber TaxID=702568 RepID=A0AAP2CE02_9BACT|nr:DUF2726 domain-containing protein [Litoribacter alkaliphilus]MBS9522408.1 DUF2726 domain-containing protein [Litoribacter alkaliphilus]
MSISENCLKFLLEKKWLELNRVLSEEKNCLELASDPVFSIFENNLVSEIRKFENENSENLSNVLTRIFQLNQNLKILKLSNTCLKQIAEYLFQKHPSEKYAKLLPDNELAKRFLDALSKERVLQAEKSILASKLNINVGMAGDLDFSKSIINSPQEVELYLAAKSLFETEILLPNTSLSSIIDSKITKLLDKKTCDFFFRSTLDLCIVDVTDFKPRFFIELDSSWHDIHEQLEKDKMKDEIFRKAGMTLHRLRKKENKSMKEAFELYLKKNYGSQN